MATFEFECSNAKCEANIVIEHEVAEYKKHELGCPFCHENMELIYSA